LNVMGNSFCKNRTGVGVKVVDWDSIRSDNYRTRTGMGLIPVEPGWEWERQQREWDRMGNDILDY